MPKPLFYAFDIDGTILTSDHRILPSTKQAIQMIKDTGAQIMLASGRPPKAIDPIAWELGLPPFYIGLNGAVVMRDNEVIFEKPMGRAVLQEIMGRASAADLSINVLTIWDWFIEKTNFLSTREGDIIGYYGVEWDLTKIAEAHKLLLLGDEASVAELRRELADNVPEVTASLSFPGNLEVVSSSVSKAHALEIVSDSVQIALKDMVVFGDGENDLSMLKMAGFSVAMANAHPTLLGKADLVTSSNNEDGILRAVEKILQRRV